MSEKQECKVMGLDLPKVCGICAHSEPDNPLDKGLSLRCCQGKKNIRYFDGGCDRFESKQGE